jgi:protein arginine kinase activator
MLCQSCNKNSATVYIKQTINGKTTERYLCPECAAQLGYGSGASPVEFPFGALLNPFKINPKEAEAREEACPSCHMTRGRLIEEGKAGCPECYAFFGSLLLPAVKRIHGNAEHTGKAPKKADAGLALKKELRALKEQLDAAVSAQEYEKAAELLKQIKAREAGKGEDDA